MQQRSPALVFFLSLITFGIYALVWQVKTKGELNRLGANIPSAWLIIVPLANLYWIWKYCEGVEQVSNGQISAVLALILLLLLSIVGLAILQSEFNKLSLQPAGPVPGPGAAPQPQQFGTTTINPSQPGPVPPTYPAQPPATDNPTEPTPPVPPAPPSPPLPPSPIQ
jgi:ABC-type transport system involved in multi-copper enzyme maturation permease subunit